MASDTGDRMRIVIGYAVWATLCAAAAGVTISLIHTWFFTHEPGPVGFWRTLFDDGVRAVAIAAGQGAVALVTGSLLAHFGRSLHVTVLLGLLVGAFDFTLTLLQMVVPSIDIGWVPNLLILAAATIAFTVLGSRSATAPSPPP